MFEMIRAELSGTGWVEYVGTAAGITGVWLGIRENIAAWPIFLVCYAAYIFLAYQAGLFATMGLNLTFIALSIYGWMTWSNAKTASDPGRQISRMPRRELFAALVFWAIGTVVIGTLLDRYAANAYRPYVDAFATCGAFVAQWMLGRKYLGNWVCWIIADLVFIVLWLERGYWVTVGLYTVFILLAIHGWITWRRKLSPPQTLTLTP